MKIRNQRVTRRQALARLGLAAGAAYAAPALFGLSRAHAASSASAASAASAASPASPASAASPASSASPASTPSGAELPEGENKADGCTLGTVPEHATISQTDMRNAQRAIDRENAMPLRQVVAKVKKTPPWSPDQCWFFRTVRQADLSAENGFLRWCSANRHCACRIGAYCRGKRLLDAHSDCRR